MFEGTQLISMLLFLQEELFDQILSGLFEFNSPDWDSVSYPAKVYSFLSVKMFFLF